MTEYNSIYRHLVPEDVVERLGRALAGKAIGSAQAKKALDAVDYLDAEGALDNLEIPKTAGGNVPKPEALTPIAPDANPTQRLSRSRREKLSLSGQLADPGA